MELAWVYSAMGEREKAFRFLDQLSELSTHENLPRIPLALVHIGLGDMERAFELLEEGYAQRDSNLLYLQCEPGFDPLRSDTRYQDLVNRMGFQRPGVTSKG